MSYKQTPFEIRRDAGNIRQDRGTPVAMSGPDAVAGGPLPGNSVFGREAGYRDEIAALEALIDAATPTVSINSALPDPATIGTDLDVDVLWQASEPGTYSVLLDDVEIDSGDYDPVTDDVVTTTILIGDLAVGVNTITVNVTNVEDEIGTDSETVTVIDPP